MKRWPDLVVSDNNIMALNMFWALILMYFFYASQIYLLEILDFMYNQHFICFISQDLDTVDVSDDAPGEIPLAYCCPVCLDVFYNAYNVRPCGHTFCEPCLRRLAKYSQDARKPTSCPVCRNLIDTCTKNKG